MKKHILIIFFFLLYFVLYGQITTEEEPISFGRSIPALTINQITHKVLPSIDRYALEQEDKEDEAKGMLPRFGFPHEVNYNLENSGEWITLSNGDKLWRLKHWLDPNNTGATTLNGTFECDGNITINNKTYNSSVGTNIGCVITITNTTFNSGAAGKYYAQNKILIYPNTIVDAGVHIIFAARGNGGGRDEENLAPPFPEPNEELYDEMTLVDLEKATAEPHTAEVDFTLYPNPNDGNFTVRITGKIEPYTLEIFNAMGVLIGMIDCHDEIVQVNQSDLPAGIYYVKMTITDKIIVKKVVIQ
jgi:hypothetical protein